MKKSLLASHCGEADKTLLRRITFGGPSWQSWGAFLLPALIGTILSMARTGYTDGLGNNFFHWPILAGLPALPQFATDPFISTLPRYASPFWQIFAGRVPLDSAPVFLLIWLIISRFLAIVGFLACADVMGIRSLVDRLAFVVLIAFSSILISFSAAGGGGLFINHFTHSELANATILLTVWCTARRNYAGAMALNGVTFFLNAFMAAWAFAPMLAIALYDRARGEVDARTIARRTLLGLPVFALLAAPALAIIVVNPDFGRPIQFDFVDFLAEYAPVHFLIWLQPVGQLMALGFVVLAGSLASLALRRANPRSAFCLVTLLAFCGLWLAGTVLPFVTHQSLLLSLHLLRTSSCIQLFAGLALAALPVIWWREGGTRTYAWGPLVTLGVVVHYLALPIAALAILADGARKAVPQRWRIDKVVAVTLLTIWPIEIIQVAQTNAFVSQQHTEWRRIGLWAKANTRPDALFLLPMSNTFNPAVVSIADPSQIGLEFGSEVFQTAAERQIWTDFRSGGAVMWAHDFYPIWHRRVHEALALPDHAARIAYSRAHGVSFLIDGCGSAGSVAFAVGDRCVYDLGKAGQHAFIP